MFELEGVWCKLRDRALLAVASFGFGHDVRERIVISPDSELETFEPVAELVTHRSF